MTGTILSGIGKELNDKAIKNKQTMDMLFKLPKKIVVETETTGMEYNFAIIYQQGEVWANYFAETNEGQKVLTMDVKPSKTLHEALLKINKQINNEDKPNLQ